MRQTLMRWFQGTDIDLTAPMASDLNGNVRGCAKPIEAEPLAWLDSTQTQSPVANDPGTEEGSGFFITEHRRNWIGKRCRDERILCVAAVDLIAGKSGMLTEILSPACAKFAQAACVLQPGDSDPFADFPFSHIHADPTDNPDCLVAGNERKRGVWQLTFDDMKICPANPTDRDADQNFSGARLRCGNLPQL
jgi:hypothetical protein